MAIESKIDDLKYEMQDEESVVQQARIKVVGIGGGGSNAVAHMLNAGLQGVEFYALNTDSQALAACPVANKLAIGNRVAKGRGAGGDPTVGREAALEDTERIVEILQGADMVFVTAGFGAGTGTGAAPVVASLARELNALTVAIVTKPFAFEGSRRMKQAETGIQELAAGVDTLLTVPNDRLLSIAPRGTSIVEGFRLGNEILRQTVADIVDIINTPGLINRDFSDVRSVMTGQGYAVMGSGTAKGENGAVEAARQAMECPLLEERGIRGATNLLINITGSSSLGLHEVNEACAMIRDATGTEDTQVNFGVVLNEAMGDSVKVMVLATGFEEQPAAVVSAFAEPVISAPAGQETPDWFPPASQVPVTEPPRVEEQPFAAVSEPDPLPMPVAAPAVHDRAMPLLDSQPEDDMDDLDTPAFLRSRRR